MEYANIIQLPLPYEAYHEMNQMLYSTFEEYKVTIYNWINKNMLSDAVLETDIISHFEMLVDGHVDVKDWLINHKESLRLFDDISGLAFGVKIVEVQRCVKILYMKYDQHENHLLFPNIYGDYNYKMFHQLDDISKLNWLYERCEFIPYQILRNGDFKISAADSEMFRRLYRK